MRRSIFSALHVYTQVADLKHKEGTPSHGFVDCDIVVLEELVFSIAGVQSGRRLKHKEGAPSHGFVDGDIVLEAIFVSIAGVQSGRRLKHKEGNPPHGFVDGDIALEELFFSALQVYNQVADLRRGDPITWFC